MRAAPLLAVALLALGGHAPPAQAQPVEAGLDAPPAWRVGDWWDVRLTNFWAEGPSTGRLVVAARDGQGWLVGMPRDAFRAEHLIHATVPLGALGADLSRASGDGRFEPLRFPLEQGARWVTALEGAPYLVEVAARDARGAEVAFAPMREGAEPMRARYDPALGMFAWFEKEGVWRWEVVGRGSSGGCGAVDVPVGVAPLFTDLTSPTSDPGPAERTPGVQRALVDAGPDAVALYVFALARGSGMVSETVTSPRGVAYQATAGHALGAAHQLRYFLDTQPAGLWTMERAIVGGGVAWAQGVGFDLLPFPAEGCGPAPARALAGPPARAQLVPPRDPGPADWSGPLAGLGVMVAGAFALSRWALPRAFLGAFYHRVRRDDLLGHPVRRAVVQTLQQQPGATMAELRRTLGAPRGSLAYHLQVLSFHGVVVPEAWGRARDWYLAALHDPVDRRRRTALRRPATARVLQAIQAQPGITQQQLAHALGVHHASVVFHATRLERAGLVERRVEGRVVRYHATGR